MTNIKWQKKFATGLFLKHKITIISVQQLFDIYDKQATISDGELYC